MKKILLSIFSLFHFFTILIILLSTTGIETKRFNNLISNRINQVNKDVNLNLDTIKFKLDVKLLSLFLETNNLKIVYRDSTIPAKSIKVYIDFISILKSDIKIGKINLILNKIDIDEIKKISVNFKPSNLNSFINNKIVEGKLDTEIEFYLNEKNLLNNFIAKGTVSDLNFKIKDDLSLEKATLLSSQINQIF